MSTDISDGQHTTKLFDDRVAAGPVKPLDASFASMLDPAWLLTGWRLSVTGPASIAGWNGIRIRAVAAGTADNGADNLFTRADVVVDAELGAAALATASAVAVTGWLERTGPDAGGENDARAGPSSASGRERAVAAWQPATSGLTRTWRQLT